MVLAALALGPAGTLVAQDAPEPEEPASAEEPDRWGAEIGLALNSSGGNENLTVLTTEVGLTHLETKSYELRFNGRFRYGRSEGEQVANSLSGSLSADLWPEAGWSPFLFATAERDPFRKLDIRLSSGSGIKRTLYRKDWDEVSISGAVLYSLEKTEEPLDPELGDGKREVGRWSWRGRARHQVRDGTRIEQTVFFQPAWDRFDDYLIEARSSGRLGLTRTLALTATALYERDSTPAPEIGPDDWSLSVGLTLATAW